MIRGVLLMDVATMFRVFQVSGHSFNAVRSKRLTKNIEFFILMFMFDPMKTVVDWMAKEFREVLIMI